MSETVKTNDAAENAESVDETVAANANGDNAMAQAQSDAFTAIKTIVGGLITQANAIADDVNANRVDPEAKAKEILANSEDYPDDKILKQGTEQIDSMLDKIDEIRKKMMEHVKKEYVPESGMDDSTFEVNKTKYVDLTKQISSTLKLAEKIPGYSEATFSDLPKTTNMKGVGAAKGSGPKRPRLSYVAVNGEPVSVKKTVKVDGKDVEKDSYTFTLAAEKINKAADATGDERIKPSELNEAAIREHGSDDLSTAADGVTFKVTVKGKEFEVTAKAE